MIITFVSCFYIIKSKFDIKKYVEWMDNLISIVNNFNLVIYTNNESKKYINTNNNPKIKIIIKEFEDFYNYKYEEYWIKNHKINRLLNNFTDWKLNMLWSEKIHFVKDTYNNNYFETEYYGWCDIGYFRNRNNDLKTNYLTLWPNDDFFMNYDKNKICYGIINNDDEYLNFLYQLINDKNEKGLPKNEIPDIQLSVSGGFFIIHKDKIYWWLNSYDIKLRLYFENSYLVKDDQIILIDCIMTELSNFYLMREQNENYDNWFMFQRILLKFNEEHNISILLPIYNGIEFIEDCVKSVISQTYNKWELLIGVNGHKENSYIYKKAKEYENDKIKVFDFYNIKGKSNTLNELIKHSKYDYIALIDVDDIWLNDKLKIQNQYLNIYDVVSGNCVYFGSINNVIPEIPQGDISNFNFKLVNPIINSSSIIKKELCFWNNNYDGIEDYELWLRLRAINKKFYNCKQILVKHRIHNNSAFNSKGNHTKVEELLKQF
jgi:teichuronic acid biosynthesis glycosyltransferase TuaG